MWTMEKRFKENSKLKKQKIKEKREELLRLLAKNEEWYKEEKNSELYKKIMHCCEEFRQLTSSNQKIQTLEQEEYKRLRSLGFTLNEIANYYGVSTSYLKKWRDTIEN